MARPEIVARMERRRQHNALSCMSTPSNHLPTADQPSTAPSRDSRPLTGTTRTNTTRTPRSRGIPELSDLVLACRHHLMLTTVLSFTVAAGFAVFAWTMIDATYHADGLVRVREKQNVILSAQTSRSEDVAFFRTQAKLVQSPQVLAAALADEQVISLAQEIPDVEQVKWLAEQLQVETQSGSEVMSITINHPSPELAQALCNAVTKAYMAEINHRMLDDRSQRQQELQRAAMLADAQLDASWKKLNRIAEDVGSDNAHSLTLRDELQLQAYREQTRQLQAAELRGNQLRTQLADHQLHNQQRSIDDSQATESLIQKDPEIRAARNRLIQLNLQINQMQKIAADPDATRLVQLTDQREILGKELRTLVARSRAAVNQSFSARSRVAYEQSLSQIQQQIELNRSEKEYLRGQLAEINPVAMTESPKTAVPLDISRHDVEREQRLADSLWRTIQELKIESQSQPRVTLIEFAALPEHASHSKQIKGAAVSGMAGWMFVVMAIGFLEWRDCRIRHPDDVTQRTGFPVFGTASFSGPMASRGFSPKRSLASILGFASGQPSSGVREAATRIILRDQDNASTPTVMITSCVSSEPRHLVSIETALLLARFRRRVLLIDCDIDHSQLSYALGASKSVGMRQLPVGEITPTFEAISQLLVATDDDHIDFLPAGPDAGDTSWIDPRSLRSTIAAMREVYDVIIVNGPSLMGSAESVLLANEVDASVFAVFINQSRFDQLSICEAIAFDAGVSVGGSILQRGKRRCNLRLQPNQTALRNAKRPTPSSQPVEPNQQECANEDASHDTIDELNLQRNIDELQQELRRIQSSGKVDQSSPSADAPTNNQDKQTRTTEI